MKRPKLYQMSIFVIPALCLGLTGALNSYQWHRLQTLEGKLQTTLLEIREARQLIASIEKRGTAGFIATVSDTPEEQVAFVSALRNSAAQCSVRLTQWGAAPAPAIAPPEGAPPAAKELLAKVTPLANQITVSGTYDQIRAFLYMLTSQERLVSLSSIRWKRAPDAPDTTLSFQLTRYVGSLDTPAPPTAQ